MSISSQFGGLALAFRNRNFLVYALGSLPSQLGTWMQRVAVGWLTWRLTESAAWLGIIAFVDLFPVVVIGPLAGALADRIDRLRFSRLLQYGNMIVVGLIAALTIARVITIESLFALALIQGVLHAAFQPFRQAVVANMATGDDLAAIIAVNSVTWQGSRLVGPAVAGFTIVTWGIGATIAITAATYALFIAALHRIRLPAPPRSERSLRDIPAEIAEGIRYCIAHPVIGPLLFILLCASFLGRPVTELLPGFAAEVFGRGAVGLAWLTSSAGLGAMLGGLWLGRRGQLAGLMEVVVVNVLVLALALIAFAATDVFWLALAMMAAVGFALIVNGVTIQTIVQSVVDEPLRGRTLSLYGLVWLGCPALGAVIMGALSEVFGLRWPVVGAGALCLLAFLWALSRRAALAGAMGASGS